MAINPSLLISAAILQDYLVDKDAGLPLSSGIITLYSDTQRSLLKPWYMQQGTNPPYSYVELPNPMTLSAVGTIQDVDGNDVIPFFYPYETDNVTFDSYYITVQNSDLELQFTRSNFPFVATLSTTSEISTNENIITNSCFWRNLESITLNSSSNYNTISINSNTLYYYTVAPSQHDGYIMPDINYFKNATDGTDEINFNTFTSSFPDNILIGDITPEFYMNINCTSIGSSTLRYLQIPLSLHIDSLSGFTQDSFTVQAMSVDGLNETLTVGIYQFCGTGVTTPPISVKTFVLGPGWNKFVINLPIPSAQGVTVGQGGDDALYIQIGFPSSSVFNVNIALPSFYLSNTAATNSFQTYDQVNSIISSPRTGDVRISNNSFNSYGWTAMNDGVIALTTPTGLQISRINKDTWPLYNLMWNIAKPYDTGSNSNPICQMYTALGAATNFGSTSYSDFISNKSLALTKSMGRVFLGTVPISSLINTYRTTFVASNSAGTLLLTTANNVNFFKGMPITFSTTGTLPTGIVSTNVYYVGSFNGTTGLFVSTSFSNAMSGTYIAFTNTGSGTHTITSANTGAIEGQYAHTQLESELAIHHHSPLGGGIGFDVRVAAGGDSNFNAGTQNRADATTGNTGSSTPFNITQPGTFGNIFIKL